MCRAWILKQQKQYNLFNFFVLFCFVELPVEEGMSNFSFCADIWFNSYFVGDNLVCLISYFLLDYMEWMDLPV